MDTNRESLTLRLLREHPAGMDEYGLIKALQDRPEPDGGLPPGSLIEPMTLFRCHFLLYNALYRLRDRLWQQRQAHLEISPLNTVLHPYRAGGAGLAEYDPLRAFYLDMSHLETTTEADVVEMLGRFWAKLHANEHKTAALRTLGLEDPVDYDTVRQRYRRLAMRHHPDRGGDNEQLQAINAAMATLESYYLV